MKWNDNPAAIGSNGMADSDPVDSQAIVLLIMSGFAVWVERLARLQGAP